ncbi:MAG: hypothetical protein IJ013_07240 [Bacteroidaceae bacterium]|nr:hypothetical protein [Bacteroidaceae bacterium]
MKENLNKERKIPMSQLTGESAEEKFKRKHPVLSKIISCAIDSGHDFEYELFEADRAILWYNDQLQNCIKRSMKTGYKTDLLDRPFMTEFKNGDVSIITLRDYIISVIKETPIEVAFCTPFIFRTDKAEYTMNSEFKIEKWNFSVSNYNKVLSNGKKYIDVLVEILINRNSRTEIIETYGIKDSTLDSLYILLESLNSSYRSDWQILKELQLSHSFMDSYCSILLPYMLDKNKEDFWEVIEILNS